MNTSAISRKVQVHQQCLVLGQKVKLPLALNPQQAAATHLEDPLGISRHGSVQRRAAGGVLGVGVGLGVQEALGCVSSGIPGSCLCKSKHSRLKDSHSPTVKRL